MTPSSKLWTRRAIAVLQIAGGAYGLSIFISSFSGTAPTPAHLPVVWLIALASLTLAAASLYAGLLLAEGHAQGIRLSQYVQWIQVPSLSIPLINYAMGMGPMFRILLVPQTPDVLFQFNFGYTFDFWIQPAQFSWAFGANITAVVCLYFLRKLRAN